MIEIRRGAQIDKKLATVRNLITRETAGDLCDVCASGTPIFMRLEFYRGQARDIARRLVDRVLAQMRMGRMSCFPMCGTSQNQQPPLGRANFETGRLTDESGINLTKLWFDRADAFAAALFIRNKCKSDRALKVSVLDLTGCHDHRGDAAFGV